MRIRNFFKLLLCLVGAVLFSFGSINVSAEETSTPQPSPTGDTPVITTQADVANFSLGGTEYETLEAVADALNDSQITNGEVTLLAPVSDVAHGDLNISNDQITKLTIGQTVPTGTASFTNLNINGLQDGVNVTLDTITVTGVITIENISGLTLDASTAKFSAVSVNNLKDTTLDFSARSGAINFVLDGDLTGTTISGGAGNDTFALNNVLSDVTLDGKGGTNSLISNMSGATTLTSGVISTSTTNVAIANIASVISTASTQAVVALPDEANTVEFTTDGSGNLNYTVGGVTYTLQGMSDISIQGGSVNDVITLKELNNSAITNFSVDGMSGNDIIKVDTSLNMPNADVNLKASQIEVKGINNTSIINVKANSLILNAAQSATSAGSIESKVTIQYANLEATSNIEIYANGSQLIDIDSQGPAVTNDINTKSSIDLADVTFKASNITVSSKALSEISGDETKSKVVNTVNNSSKVSVSGSSSFNATDKLLFSSISDVLSNVKSGAGALNVSFVVNSIVSEAILELFGGQLSAKTIDVQAINNITASAVVDGSVSADGESDPSISGAFVAINIIEQTTKADIGKDVKIGTSASSRLAASVKVKAESTLDLTTKAASVGSKYEGPANSRVELNGIVDEITSLLNIDISNALSSTLQQVLDTMSKDSTSSLTNQMVGALAFNKVTIDNNASYKANTYITDDLSVIANAKIKADINADGSATTKVENASLPVGIGVGVSLHIVDYTNKAILSSSNVAAKNINVIANETTDVNANNMSAKAGINKEGYGIGGAVGIVIYNTTSEAKIETTTIDAAGTITVKTNDLHDITLDIDCSSDKAVGAGVGLIIFEDVATSRIDSSAKINSSAALTLLTNSISKTTLDVKSGGAGGLSIAPGVAININLNDIISECLANVTSSGTVSVQSISKKTRKTTSASNLVDKGGIGATVSLVINIDKNTARLKGTTKATKVQVHATSHHRSDAYATASPEGESDSGGSDTKPEDLVNKLRGMADKLMGNTESNSLEKKFSANMSTQEGDIQVAGAVIVVYLETENNAIIDAGSITADSVEVIAKEAVAIYNFANANVSTGKTGASTAVVVFVGDIKNSAKILAGATINTGSLTVSATGDTLEKVNELAKKDEDAKTVTNDKNTIANVTTSGAGASKNTIAGAVVLVFADQKYVADVAGTVTIGKTGTTTTAVISADLKERFYSRGFSEAKYVAGGNNNSTTGKSKGIAPSFVMNYLDTKVSASLSGNGSIKSLTSTKSNVSIKATFDSSIDSEAEAGSGDGKKASDFALDGAVVLNLLSRQISATTAKDTIINVNGTISVEQSTQSTTNAKVHAGAEANGTSIGISVAVTYFKSKYEAIVYGSLTATGKLSITSTANTTDIVEATGTSKGASEDDFKSKFKDFDLKKVLSGEQKFGTGSSTKTGDKVSEFTGGAADQNTSSSILGATNVKTSNPDTTGQSKPKDGEQVAVAGAVAVTILNHDVIAAMYGTAKAAGIEIKATNNNNFKSYNGSKASSDGKAITLSVAVAILGSKTEAYGNNMTSTGDITISAAGSLNMHEDFKNSVTLLAVGMASVAKEGDLALAGSVAFLKYSNAIKAMIMEGAVVDTTGKVSVTATENTKLAAKAWNYAGGGGEGAVGIGASFAMIYASSSVQALIGKGSTLTLDSLYVEAKRTRIDPTGLSFNFEYKEGMFDDYETFDYINLTNFLAANNYYIEVIGASNASKGSFALQGSFGILMFTNTTEASIGEDVIINAINDISVKADSDINVKVITGGVANSNSVGVGLNTGTIVDESTHIASIGNRSKITTTAGGVSVSASSKQDYLVISLAGAKATDVGIAGVVNVILSYNKVNVVIGNNVSITAKKNIEVTATNESSFKGISVGAVKGSVGVGCTAAVILIDNETNATVGTGTTLITDGDISIKALSSEYLGFIITSAAVADDVAVGLSGAYAQILSKTIASIGANTTIKANNLTVEADSTSFSESINGGVAIAGTVSVSGTTTSNVMRKSVKATIGKGIVNVKNNIVVKVNSEEKILAIVAAVGGSKSVAVQGSVPVTIIENDVLASIDGEITAGNDITVIAKDSAKAEVYAGAIGGSGTVAVGAAVNTFYIQGKVVAQIGSGAIVNTKSLSISATSSNELFTILVSGVASGTVSVTGVVNTVIMTQQTKAYISDSAAVTVSGDISILADSNNKLECWVGAASVTGTVAVGASVNTIKLENKVTAGIGNSITINQKNSSDVSNLTIIATAKDDIFTMVAGIVASGGVSVSASANTILNTTTVATIIGDSSSINLNGSLYVKAFHDLVMDLNLGTASVGAYVGVGTSVLVVVNQTTISNTVGNKASITMSGQKANNGISGVSFLSDTLIEIKSVVISLGAAIAGIAPTSATFVLSGKTLNSIGSEATITSDKNISIKANTTTTILPSIGAGAGGLVGVGASVLVINSNRVTSSIVNASSTINAKGTLSLAATVSNTFTGSASGISGGAVGVAGVVNVMVIEDTVSAIASPTSKLIGTSINVQATAKQVYELNTYVVSAGGVGVSAANATITFKSTITAAISNAEATGNINVLTSAVENITTQIVGGAAGAVGVGGSVAVIISNNTMNSYIAGASTVTSGGNISVKATDSLNIDNSVAAISAGGVAVGAGVSVILVQNTIAAYIGNLAKVTATNSITVEATLNRVVSLKALAASGGYVSAGGTVSVVSLGISNDQTMNEASKKDVTVTNDNVQLALGKTKISIESSNYDDDMKAILDETNTLLDGVQVDLLAYLDGTQESNKDKTSAYIGSGANVSAKNITVNAQESNKIDIQSAAASIGAAGAGASVLVLKHGSYIQAYVGSSANLNASEDISVSASAKQQEYTINSIAGSAALSLSLGASVVYLDLRGTVNAYLGESVTVDKVRNLSVLASANYVLKTYALGAAVGLTGGAAGVSDLNINLAMNITASINNKVTINQANDIKVHAELVSDLIAKVRASAAGLVGTGQAAVLTINLKPTVAAEIGNYLTITKSNSISTFADADVKLDAKIEGISLAGGISGGASVLSINNTANISSKIGTGGTINSGTIDIYSCYNANKDGTVKTDRFKVDVSSVSGALYGSVNGLEVTIDDSLTMKTSLGSTIKAANVTVKSVSSSMMDVTASGFSAGGVSANAIMVTINSKQYVTTETASGANITASSLLVASEVFAKLVVAAIGTSGGALTAGGVVATVNLKPTITTQIGTSNTIETTGDINVRTTYNVRNGVIQEGILLSGNNAGGGAIVIAVSQFTANHEAVISTLVGNNSKVTSTNGDVNILTYAGLHASVIATTKSYGAGTGSSIKAISNVKGTITTAIDDNVTIKANTIRVKNYVYGKAYGEVTGANYGAVSVGSSEVNVTLGPTIITRTGTTAKLTATKDIQLVGYYNMKTTTATTDNPANGAEGNLAVIPDTSLGAIAKGSGSSGNLVGVIGTQITVNHSTNIQTIIKANGQLIAGNSIFTYAYAAIKNTPELKSDSGGIVSIGANQVSSVIDVTTAIKVENTTLQAEGSIQLVAYADISAAVETRQSSDGLVNAGAPNKATNNITSKTTVEVGNATLKAKDSISMSASTNIASTTTSTGKSSGGVAIGESLATSTINSLTKVIIGSATITADEDISVVAVETIKVTATSLASEGTSILGSSKGATTTINVTDNIGIEIGSSATITAKNLMLLSAPMIDINGYAKANNGGIVALGAISTDVILNLTNKITVGNLTVLTASNDLVISALTDLNIKVDGTGGSSGVFTKANIQNKIAISKAETSITFANNNTVEAGNTLKIEAGTSIVANVQAVITGSNGLAAHGNVAYATISATINNAVNLGTGGTYKGTNIYIISDISKLSLIAFAKSTSYTASSTTDIKSEINVTANTSVTSTNANISAMKILKIYALISDFKMNAKTDATIAGVTGSIKARSIANATIKATISVLGNDSVLSANDIEIKASSPINTNQVSELNNKTKVDTVVEYILVAVRKTMEVVEKVTDKIVKWLPWPFNKIVKWIVKTVVKVVEYFVDELIPKVLNSDIDTKETNNYNRVNTVTLNGSIYYGSSVPIQITIDVNGNVTSTTGATSYKDANGNIHITSFGNLGTGSLIITSYAGLVEGNITIYRNSSIEKVEIINNSNYNVYLDTISFNDETMENPEHVITAKDITLEVKYEMVGNGVTIVNIKSMYGGDIVFNGYFELLNGILQLETNAAVRTTGDAFLVFKGLEILGADKVGSANERFIIYFIDEGDEDAYIKIKASDVYLSVAGLDYVSLGNQEFPQTNLKVKFKEVIVTGAFNLRTLATMYIDNVETSEYGQQKLKPIYSDKLEEIWEYDENKGGYVFVEMGYKIIDYEVIDEFGNSQTSKTKEVDLDVIFDGSFTAKETYMNIGDDHYIFTTAGSLASDKVTMITTGTLSTSKTTGVDITTKDLTIIIDGNTGTVLNPIRTSIDNLTATSDAKVYLVNSKALTVKDLKAEEAVLTAKKLTIDKTTAERLELHSDSTINATLSVDKLFALAKANIVAVNDKALVVESLTTDANIQLTAAGNISGDVTSTYHLKGKELVVSSTTGTVGSKATPLKLYLLSNGFVDITAESGVSVEEVNDDLIIKNIVVIDGDVYAKAKAGIYGYVNATNIYAKNIELEATEDIGTSAKYLGISQSSGKLKVTTLGDIYINSINGLLLDDISANNIYLKAQDSTQMINQAVVRGNNTILTSVNGSIGVDGAHVVLDITGTLHATAKDNVYVTHTGTLKLDKVTAGATVKLVADTITSTSKPAISAESAILETTNNIGSVSERLYMTVNNLTVQASDAYVSNTKSLNMTGNSNVLGLLDVEVSGDLTGAANHLITANKLKATATSLGSATTPINLSVSRLEVDATGSVYFINDASKDLRIEKIHADTVEMTTGTVVADDITANALNGVSSGSMNLQTTVSEVQLEAVDSITLTNSKDIVINTIKSGKDVTITNDGMVNAKSGVVNIDSKNATINASSGIGEIGSYVQLNVSENLNVSAVNDVYLHESANNMNIGSIKTSGDVYLKADKSIVNRSSGNSIEAHHATLVTGGSIGEAINLLTMDLTGVLKADGTTGVYIEETSGDMNIASVNGHTGNVILKSNESIYGNGNQTHITGNNINLSSNAQIGTDANRVTVNQTGTGVLTVSAKANVYLHAINSIKVGNITTDNDIYLSADQDITADMQAYNLKGMNVVLDSYGGSIGADGAHVVLDTTGTLQATAKGNVYVTHTGALKLDKVTAGSTVKLVADTITSTSKPAINADSAVLEATNNIGSVTERLYMTVNNLTVQASDAYVSNSKSLNMTGNSNVLGLLDVEVAGNLTGVANHLITANKLKATATSLGGAATPMNLSVSRLEVDATGSVYFINDASKDLRVEKIHATAVEMTTGNVVADDIAANTLKGVSSGSINLQTTISEVQLEAKDSITLTNSKDVVINTIKSGKDVTITNDGMVNAKSGVVNIASKNATINTTKGIGSSSTYMKLNVSGNLNVKAVNDVYLHESVNNMNIGSIKTSGDVYLKADKSIVNRSSGNSIEAVNATLVASGSIGEATKLLTMDLTGVLKADGTTGVYIEETSGDMNIASVNGHTGNVVLKSNASIYGSGNQAHITGNNINLSSKAQIGTDTNRVTVNQTGTGILNATAKANVYLHAINSIKVGNITTDKDIYLSANKDIDANTQAINLKAANVTLNSISGSVGSAANTMKLIVPGTISATAANNVYLSHSGSDMNIYKIVAGKVVSLTTTGNILAKMQPTITADQVILNAGKNVGTATDRFILNTNKLAISADNAYITNLKSLQMYGSGSVNNVLDLYVKGDVSAATNTKVEATTLNIVADGNVGGTQPLQTSVKTISVKAKDYISIVNDATKNLLVSGMNSNESIKINSGNITVNSLRTNSFNLTSTGNATVNSAVNKLNMTVNGTAVYTNSKGLTVEKITVGNALTLVVNGSIYANGNTLVEGSTMNISASGNIGNANAWLRLRSRVGGYLNLSAQNYMYVEDLANMNIQSARANAVYLKAAGSINGTSLSSPVIHADALGLQAAQIGQSIQSKLFVNVNTVSANASGDIYLKNAKGLVINSMTTPASMYLEATSIIANNITGAYLNATVNGALQLNSSVSRMQLSASSIVINNSRSLEIENSKANSINLTNNGNVTTQGRISANTIDFNVQGSATLLVTTDTISGSATGNLRIDNSKSMTISANTNLKTGGNLDITTAGKLTVDKTAQLHASNITLTSSLSDGLYLYGTLYANKTTLYAGKTNEYNLDENAGSITIHSRVSDSTHKITLLSLADTFAFVGSSGKDNVNVDIGKLKATSSKQLSFDGNGGNDKLELNLSAAGAKNEYTIKNINDLVLTGQSSNDTYQLNSNKFTYDQGKGADTYNVSNIGKVTFNAVGGNNTFTFIDTFAQTEILGGNGNNTFYIGIIVNDAKNATSTTEGYLSRGTSHATSIKDGSGDSLYRIYSTKGELVIDAGKGSDRFIVKAFITFASNGSLIPYKNAAMIFHGDKNDIVEIIKSALFDDISFDGSIISGPGINITLHGIENVDIQEFSEAHNATASIATFDYILFNFEQLHQRGIMIPLVIGLLLLLAAGGFLIYNRKKKRKAIANAS